MSQNGFMQFIDTKVMPVAGRIGSQRHLVAIRDGFVAIMPLIIIGSLAVLINNFPIPEFQDFMTAVFGENWKSVGGVIWNGSFAILSLLVVAAIAYHLAESYEADGLSAALISAGTFVVLTPVTEDFGLAMTWLGAQGLFVAVITALISAELFRLFYNSDKLKIKMPEGVPTGVTKSFNALLPAAVILTLAGFFNAFVVNVTGVSIHEWVYATIQEPLQGFSNTIGSAIVFVFLNQVLWFFGLHGTNILGPIMESIYLPLIEENQALFASGVSAHEVPYIVTKPFFDAYVFMGGSGATLALIFAIFLVVKAKHYRTVGKLSLAPGAFNINEPMIFGLPVVLNPVMFVPFIIIPLLMTANAYFAIYFGLVPKTVAILPWTTPPIISGYLVSGGSFTGVVLQLVNLTMATLIYIPFIKLAERASIKKLEEQKAAQVTSDAQGWRDA
ncbi:PTS cellobiose transporter subunit IIC [Pontibacillus litoralis]|uniref:Permease IIC component n=1 Tax=Pontibacillus litoralis JSM 072002 TaxID=1385512 RepID=A0A0A5G183_9BACI|nr:PTS cellobiose transporter subunit IIC [Pontibacillus litoralis]KGX86861.1 PTS lactose transporter subunit IIC [Pontibacillus litoralis JSM 072002]